MDFALLTGAIGSCTALRKLAFHNDLSSLRPSAVALICGILSNIPGLCLEEFVLYSRLRYTHEAARTDIIALLLSAARFQDLKKIIIRYNIPFERVVDPFAVYHRVLIAFREFRQRRVLSIAVIGARFDLIPTRLGPLAMYQDDLHPLQCTDTFRAALDPW